MPSALPIGMTWPEDFTLSPLSNRDKSFHAYIHIPFCSIRCGYCDFNTYAPKETEADQASFESSLVAEIRRSAEFLARSGLSMPKLSSIFFGGGTPSLFSSGQFEAIISALTEAFGIDPQAEITTEANPESTAPEFLEGIRKLGVNRLSLGVQSFDPDVLRVLDRSHTEQKVFELIPIAKSLGFEVSIDLIYGTPGESIDSWRASLEKALSLRTDHISAYSLIVEAGTKLERKVRKGELPEVDEDLNAKKHELASSLFESAGLSWYEVSNWGKPSRHNSAYWTSQNWWGYGPGAHSHIYGHRFWNVKNPTVYQERLSKQLPVAGREELTVRQMLEEELMLGLRTRLGVRSTLARELKIPGPLVARSIADGILTLEGNRLVVTQKGRLLVDRIVVDFLSQSEDIV